ncbi:MAG: MOSC domain-containing protein [Halobacteriales archaeon]
MTGGTVEAIHVAPASGQSVEARDTVEAVSGRGLREDRHFREPETEPRPPGSGQDLTLIESEALAAVARDFDVELEAGEHRRNLTTRGVALNHLVDERFRVGEVVCQGVELCEPCRHLEGLTEDGMIQALVHRGGLRADILEGGTVAVGDGVREL